VPKFQLGAANAVPNFQFVAPNVVVVVVVVVVKLYLKVTR
jgi:hypothetical protein